MHGNGSTSKRDTPVLRGYAGKVLGRICDSTLVRKVGERERLRLLDAWPLGAVGVASAKRLGIQALCYRSDDGTYEVAFADFLRLASRRTFPTNPEEQYLLPRSAWTFTPAAPRPAPVVQFDLFESVAV